MAMPRLLDLQHIAGASQLAVLSDESALIIDGIYTSQMRAQRLTSGLKATSKVVWSTRVTRIPQSVASLRSRAQVCSSCRSLDVRFSTLTVILEVVVDMVAFLFLSGFFGCEKCLDVY